MITTSLLDDRHIGLGSLSSAHLIGSNRQRFLGVYFYAFRHHELCLLSVAQGPGPNQQFHDSRLIRPDCFSRVRMGKETYYREPYIIVVVKDKGHAMRIVIHIIFALALL